ncbi:MAG: FkbM family methyltransferase [Desulfobacterales bacterium]|nr:FkbM family methyltransferase [Desulfobacterales bacterium]
MQITQVRHSGYDLNVRVRTPWLDMNVATEVIANDNYRLHELKDIGIEPKVILDIGGHIGTFGLICKSLWPDARLIAVEPDSDNANLYKLNIEQNHPHTDFVILNQAISYSPERICLVHSPSTTGGNVLCPKEEAEKYVNEGYRFYNSITNDHVSLTTIGEICRTYDIDVIDLAKWDCEGSEVDAFLNMSDKEAEKFRFMVGEYHLWSENTKYLKADLFTTIKFWRRVKRKFPHLNFDYRENRLGLFQAWPKENK